MPRWQGKSRGTKLGYGIFVFVCRHFGVYPAYLLLYFVALYYFLFAWSSSRIILSYFHDRLGYAWLTSLICLYRNYYIFGQTILDKIIVMAGIQNKFTYHFDGRENLDELVKGGKGGILLSAHVGNWEIAGHFLKHLGTKINIVMYDGEHQHIKDYMNEVLGERNFNIIVIRDDISHIYEISEALQQNQLICIHADRFQEGNKTRCREFLGKEAQFPIGPFSLAYAFKVPIAVAFAFKESNTHYHFFGSKPMLPNDDKEETINRLMDFFIEELEQKIGLYPIQWFNYYDFWLIQ